MTTLFAYLLLLIFLSEFLLHGQLVDELQLLFRFHFRHLHRLLELAPDFIELLIEFRSPLLVDSKARNRTESFVTLEFATNCSLACS